MLITNNYSNRIYNNNINLNKNMQQQNCSFGKYKFWNHIDRPIITINNYDYNGWDDGIGFLPVIVGLIMGGFVGICGLIRYTNHPTNIENTKELKKEVKKLDKAYDKGTILYNEHLSGLNSVQQKYDELEKTTAQKLDDVVQKRPSRSNIDYPVDSTGKYVYTLNLKNGKVDIITP